MESKSVIAIEVALLGLMGVFIGAFPDHFLLIVFGFAALISGILAVHFYMQARELSEKIKKNEERYKKLQYRHTVWIIGKRTKELEPVGPLRTDDTAYITLKAPFQVRVTTTVTSNVYTTKTKDDKTVGHATTQERFRPTRVPRGCTVNYSISSESRLPNRVEVSVWLFDGDLPSYDVAGW